MNLQKQILEQIELRKKHGDDIFCKPNSRFYPKAMHNYKLIDNSNGKQLWICRCGAKLKEASK